MFQLLSPPELEELFHTSVKCIRAWVSLWQNSQMFWKQDALSLHYKKRNGKRNSIERKKPNSLSRIPSPTGINTDLSSWPSLWLSSFPRVTEANWSHWRRIGGMAQLLWEWLEFPVSFLTDAIRKVQSCNNSAWGRSNTEQSQWAIAVTYDEGGKLFQGNSLLPKIFRWKMSKESFMASMLNVLQKMNMLWCSLRICIKATPNCSNYHPPQSFFF